MKTKTLEKTNGKKEVMWVESAYIQYLTSIIGGASYKGKQYNRLINILYDTEFYWYVNNDDNRASAGVAFRYDFAREYEYRGADLNHIAIDILGGPCRFLEMLVGLADSMDDYFNRSGDSSVGRWFWEMCDNCGLTYYSDDLVDPNFTDNVHDILCNIMDRRYLPNGAGGLFPLKMPAPDLDMTKVELWYQMLYYIEENYE